ncbi:MAG: sulfite exporter TauE/SafE family protein [Opitutaceae bacterium]
MEFAAINSPASALVAGLVTSLHCAGMCGPLACSLIPRRGDRTDAQTVSTVYHLSRITSYAMLGALAGGFGRLPLTWISQSALRWLPWVTVIFFIALGLRWDRYIPRISGLGRWMFRLQSWLRTRSRTEAAVALGLATPLLPCGPLYFLIALAALSGSALRGVEFMIAFGLGTVPLLWLTQSQCQWGRTKLSPSWLARTRMLLAFVTAAVVGWRLRATLGFVGPDPSSLICF